MSKVNLKDKTILILDKGLTTHYAELMARSYGRVLYFMPDSDTDKKTNRSQIGTGIEGVERITDLWEHIHVNPKDRTVNIIFVPDLDFAGEEDHFKELGYAVAGNGFSGVLETDKLLLYKTLKKLGLPVAPYEKVNSIDELRECLKKKKETVYVKLRNQVYRGVTETFRCDNLDSVEPVIEDIISTVGVLKDDLEFIVQESVPSECEIGIDTLNLDGKCPDHSPLGIEGKNSWMVSVIPPELPEMFKDFMEKMEGPHAKLGCAGQYSTEWRITADGTVHCIDLTERMASPGGEMWPELYEDGCFAQAIWDMAHGIMPVLKPKARIGIELILTSDWYAKGKRVMVSFPKEIARWVRLKNYCIKDGQCWCLPNDNDSYLGGVIAVGETLEEVAKKVTEYAKQINCYKLHFEDDIIGASKKSVECAKKFGIIY